MMDEPKERQPDTDGIKFHVVPGGTNTVRKIARLQMRRSLKSHLECRMSFYVDIIMASEFCDPVSDLPLHLWSIRPFVAFSNGDLPSDPPSQFSKIDSSCRIISETECFRLRLIAPSTEGIYRFLFFPTYIGDRDFSSDTLVLPLLTEKIHVVSGDGAQRLIGASVLTSYRLIDGFVIKEDYGKTLGSHLYDSSIVMLRYLMSIYCDSGSVHEEGRKPSGSAIELGAGCGLISMWLTRYFEVVYATDKAYQLPLLSENVTLNRVGDNCFPYALDWSIWSKDEEKQIRSRLFASLRSRRQEANPYQGTSSSTVVGDYDEVVNLITGADVLYDCSATSAFFNVVRDLSTPRVTTVLLAQKLREIMGGGVRAERVDVSQLRDFRARKVAEEADVVLWELMKIQEEESLTEMMPS